MECFLAIQSHPCMAGLHCCPGLLLLLLCCCHAVNNQMPDQGPRPSDGVSCLSSTTPRQKESTYPSLGLPMRYTSAMLLQAGSGTCMGPATR